MSASEGLSMPVFWTLMVRNVSSQSVAWDGVPSEGEGSPCGVESTHGEGGGGGGGERCGLHPLARLFPVWGEWWFPWGEVLVGDGSWCRRG